jgi:hypothetical protein
MPMNPRLLRPTASGFNPKSISGLAAWHDAGDSSTVTLDSGRVSAWADKSGNGRTMSNSSSGSTQPDYVTAGQNGRNVIRFAAASIQRLTAAAASTYNFLHNGTPTTVMIAAKAADSNDPNALLGLMGSRGTGGFPGILFCYEDRTNLGADLNNSANFAVAGAASVFAANTFNRPGYKDTFLPNIYSVLTLAIDATNATAAERFGFAQNNASLAKDNTFSSAVSTANASQAMQYGAAGNNAFPFTGELCEILMWTKLLSSAERTAVRKYLYGKWGITP